MSIDERLHAYARAFARSRAEEVIPMTVGTAYLNPSLPRVYDLNLVVVERRGPGFDEVAREVEGVLGGAGLEHRKFVVGDEDYGHDLARAREDHGRWHVSRLIDMVWEEDPGGTDGIAEEFSFHEVREFRERQNRAFFGNDDDLVGQFLARDKAHAQAGDTRFFGVRNENGVVQCSLNLFRIGDVAEIDDVQTARAARGSGYARAAVLRAARAARAAGAAVVFLSADEDDWPKALYTALGFTSARRRFEFLHALRP